MPAWVILLRDVALIIAWELIRSGDRVKKQWKEALHNEQHGS